MSEKITDLQKVKQEKRDKSGWTLEEIKENAKRELKKFKKLAENEPKDLASGDMKKAIDDEDCDNDDKKG